MSEPVFLESRYQWRMPVIVAGMAMLFCIALLVRNQPSGATSAIVTVVAVWIVFVAVVWRRTRARLGTDADVLLVRSWRTTHRVVGADIVAVRETLTPSGACHRLTVRNPDGSTSRVAVPTAMLRTGHSTLFTWILTWAPRAELDRGSRRTLDDLRRRGLLPATGTDRTAAATKEERARRG